MFFGLIDLRVNEMLSCRHVSSTMDDLISSLKSLGFHDSHIVRFFPLNPRYTITHRGSDPMVLPWLGSNDHDHVAIS
jgi:hypothetical protein